MNETALDCDLVWQTLRTIPDPEFGKEPCSKFTPPAMNLTPHSAEYTTLAGERDRSLVPQLRPFVRFDKPRVARRITHKTRGFSNRAKRRRIRRSTDRVRRSLQGVEPATADILQHHLEAAGVSNSLHRRRAECHDHGVLDAHQLAAQVGQNGLRGTRRIVLALFEWRLPRAAIADPARPVPITVTSSNMLGSSSESGCRAGTAYSTARACGSVRR